jgi:predicted O-methyltransferase YrrM
MILTLPQNVLGKLRENFNEFGFRETLERSGIWLAEHLVASAVHRHSRPPLSAFEEAATSMHSSADELARTYLVPKTSEAEWPRLRSEYDALRREATRRRSELTGAYPWSYAIEQGSAFLLYALVRLLRPSVVLETGVSNGHSSFFILSAMLANGRGSLHSVDRSSEVGGLLTDLERKRWHLHVLRAKGLKKSFLGILQSLPPLDLFLHDSDHTYPWQIFELETVWSRLAPGAVLASDDCDCSYAFLDACQKKGVRPVILVEPRKVFGLIFTRGRVESGAVAASDQRGVAGAAQLARV